MTNGEIFRLLERPHDVSWSLQGFGMLRTYITRRVRLHVWDGDEAVPGVSTIHDHPWDFSSEIISGVMVNWRYVIHDVRNYRIATPLKYNLASIVCGPGGGMVPGEPAPVWLVPQMPEPYMAGNTYSQHAEELHASEPSRGCVSLITRVFKDNTEVAHVCWPAGTEWVSAEPRPATYEEVRRITRLALEHWSGG